MEYYGNPCFFSQLHPQELDDQITEFWPSLISPGSAVQQEVEERLVTMREKMEAIRSRWRHVGARSEVSPW